MMAGLLASRAGRSNFRTGNSPRVLDGLPMRSVPRR